MAVEGARVTVDETEGGVAMVFTTSSGDIADLRTRVRRMADMHGQMSGMKGDDMHHRQHTGGTGGGMHAQKRGMMAMVPSDANVVDIQGGARLELRPRDPSQVDELRAHARAHAQHMATGQCPMMDEHGTSQAHRQPSAQPAPR